jgi:recombination protein RecA
MAKDSKLQDELDQVLGELAKKFGYAVAYKASESPIVNIERIGTGSLSLDVELGGGFPCGRVCELYGEESSAKSTMALKTVVSAQKNGKRCVYIDVENTFSRTWAKALGVDLEQLIIANPQTAEQSLEILEAAVRSGKCGVVVLDSIAALNPQSELDKSLTDDSAKIGERALLLSRFMPRLQSALNTPNEDGTWNQTLVLLINQTRMKIGVLYGNPETTPGGQAVKFTASVRVRFSHGAWIEKDTDRGEKTRVGHTVKFLIKKSKVSSSGQSSEFSIYF